jgi:hypothetical protein
MVAPSHNEIMAMGLPLLRVDFIVKRVYVIERALDPMV